MRSRLTSRNIFVSALMIAAAGFASAEANLASSHLTHGVDDASPLNPLAFGPFASNSSNPSAIMFTSEMMEAGSALRIASTATDIVAANILPLESTALATNESDATVTSLPVKSKKKSKRTKRSESVVTIVATSQEQEKSIRRLFQEEALRGRVRNKAIRAAERLAAAAALESEKASLPLTAAGQIPAVIISGKVENLVPSEATETEVTKAVYSVPGSELIASSAKALVPVEGAVKVEVKGNSISLPNLALVSAELKIDESPVDVAILNSSATNASQSVISNISIAIPSQPVVVPTILPEPIKPEPKQTNLEPVKSISSEETEKSEIIQEIARAREYIKILKRTGRDESDPEFAARSEELTILENRLKDLETGKSTTSAVDVDTSVVADSTTSDKTETPKATTPPKIDTSKSSSASIKASPLLTPTSVLVAGATVAAGIAAKNLLATSDKQLTKGKAALDVDTLEQGALEKILSPHSYTDIKLNNDNIGFKYSNTDHTIYVSKDASDKCTGFSSKESPEEAEIKAILLLSAATSEIGAAVFDITVDIDTKITQRQRLSLFKLACKVAEEKGIPLLLNAEQAVWYETLKTTYPKLLVVDEASVDATGGCVARCHDSSVPVFHKAKAMASTVASNGRVANALNGVAQGVRNVWRNGVASMFYRHTPSGLPKATPPVIDPKDPSLPKPVVDPGLSNNAGG